MRLVEKALHGVVVEALFSGRLGELLVCSVADGELEREPARAHGDLFWFAVRPQGQRGGVDLDWAGGFVPDKAGHWSKSFR
jgi:hypothetical protein